MWKSLNPALSVTGDTQRFGKCFTMIEWKADLGGAVQECFLVFYLPLAWCFNMSLNWNPQHPLLSLLFLFGTSTGSIVAWQYNCYAATGWVFKWKSTELILLLMNAEEFHTFAALQWQTGIYWACCSVYYDMWHCSFRYAHVFASIDVKENAVWVSSVVHN